MIVPAGSPAWTRTATPDIYGAVPGLHDLGGVGAVNAKTDITAAEYVRMAADVASAVRAAPLFWMAMRAVLPGVGVASVQVQQCSVMWDSPSGAYEDGESPPTGSYPTVRWSGPSIEITFPDLLTTIGGVKYLRAPDDFGVYGNCRIESVDVSVGGMASVTSAQITDGTRINLTSAGFVDGAYIFLVAR